MIPAIMGWATGYIDRLKRGETNQFRPRGDSMASEINSGQFCTVVPVKMEDLQGRGASMSDSRNRNLLRWIIPDALAGTAHLLDLIEPSRVFGDLCFLVTYNA